MCLRDYDAPRKSPHIYQRLILFNLNSFQLIRVILMYLEPRAEKTGAPKKPDSQHAARREELREIGHNFIHPHHGNVLCSRKKVRSARQVTLGETMPYAVPTSKPTFRNVLNAMQAFSITFAVRLNVPARYDATCVVLVSMLVVPEVHNQFFSEYIRGAGFRRPSVCLLLLDLRSIICPKRKHRGGLTLQGNG